MEVDNSKPHLAPVPVPDSLDNPHPLVAATLKLSRRAKQQDDRTLMLHGPGGVTVDATRAGLDRAFRIVDGLLRALDAKGCSFKAANGGEATCAVVKAADDVPFSIEEVVRRSEKPLTPWQLKDRERSPWRYSTPRYDYEPTGDFVLRLDIPWYVKGRRKRWSDGTRQRLEVLLPRLVNDILETLEALREHREEMERAARERERLRQERLLQAQEKFQNDRRASIVRERLGLWSDVQTMKVWLQEVRDHDYPGMNVEFRKTWIGWIERYLEEAAREAVRFPQFAQEPSWDDRTKYHLWGD